MIADTAKTRSIFNHSKPGTQTMEILTVPAPCFDTPEHRLQKLKQALNKQIPDMKNGFSIVTGQGEIWIDPAFTADFQELTAEILTEQVHRLIRF
ncbi:MAG: hypothetical protein LBD10_14125 [Desulfobulbus sp.]|jgi:hypothetical protein|uniref:hypothetical protein n=1 Tax=Desulfobulbus sp. TaxID=895 RepID=UPI002845863F|nr:hypothetical protein [Desulfobulbus sp.]MDR2551328.1 hypothetical protein [Desulfobulbus sp.]